MAEPERRGTGDSNKRENLSTRAARFLHFGKAADATGNGENALGLAAHTEKQGLGIIDESIQDSASDTLTRKTTYEEEARAENIDRRRYVQTLPPWIHSFQEGENVKEFQQHQPLVCDPPRIKAPQHNHTPNPKHEPKQVARGRTWDHARSGEAFTMPFPSPDTESRWAAFVRSSAYPQSINESSEIVTGDWVRENIPSMEKPWMPAPIAVPEKAGGMWLFSVEKRNATSRRFQRILMKNPFIPLVIRLTVLAFCLVALALGTQIYQRSAALNHSPAKKSGTHVSPMTEVDYICKQQASTYMAFIVDACAVIYLFFITYDEYFSKPLGQRRSKDKIRLLFFDLLFIIFSAANLSLAFNTLTDQQWSCYEGTAGFPNSQNAEAARSTCVVSTYLCSRQKGLVSVLLIAEISWVTTFAISILRVVERVQR